MNVLFCPARVCLVLISGSISIMGRTILPGDGSSVDVERLLTVDFERTGKIAPRLLIVKPLFYSLCHL